MMPVNQQMEISNGLVVDRNAQAQLQMYNDTFNAASIKQLTENKPITRQNVT